jgi:hypothetical protein
MRGLVPCTREKGGPIMNTRTWLQPVLMAVALTFGVQGALDAQVVEKRGSEANPAAAMFRATLYGAGTGLALGGAYALVHEGDDPSTGEILKWGVAGGAAAGLVVGLVYVATRSEPEGSAEDVGLLQLQNGDLRVAAPGMLRAGSREVPGGRATTLDMNLFAVKVR